MGLLKIWFAPSGFSRFSKPINMLALRKPETGTGSAMLGSRKFVELDSGSDTEVGPDGVTSVEAYRRKRAKAGAGAGTATLPALKDFVASLKDTVHGSYWITEPSVRMSGRAANVILKTIKLNEMDEPQEVEFREKIFPLALAGFGEARRYLLPYFMGAQFPFRMHYNHHQKENIARIRLDLVLAGTFDPNRRSSQRKAWEEYLQYFARLPPKEARKLAKPKLEPSSALYRSFFQHPLCETHCLGLVLDLAGLR